MTTAIIVVDVQKDFVEGGALAVTGGQSVADRLLPILDRYMKTPLTSSGVVVAYTKDFHIDPGTHFSDEPDYIDSWPRHCEANTDGAEFAANFPAGVGDNVFYKGQYEAAYSGAEGKNVGQESLVDWLRTRGVDYAHVVGIAYDYCVKATALDLRKEGFDVTVDKSFTASVHPDNDPVTDRELQAAGVIIL